jgi:hypothetical protein
MFAAKDRLLQGGPIVRRPATIGVLALGGNTLRRQPEIPAVCFQQIAHSFFGAKIPIAAFSCVCALFTVLENYNRRFSNYLHALTYALLQEFNTQLHSFHARARSFVKTPGVGVPTKREFLGEAFLGGQSGMILTLGL